MTRNAASYLLGIDGYGAGMALSCVGQVSAGLFVMLATAVLAVAVSRLREKGCLEGWAPRCGA